MCVRVHSVRVCVFIMCVCLLSVRESGCIRGSEEGRI